MAIAVQKDAFDNQRCRITGGVIMVNEEKVKLMTNLALYEKKEKSSIKVARYYMKDYLGVNMIITGLLITAAYIVALVIGVVYKTDFLLNNITRLDSGSISRKLIVLYVAVLAVYLLLAYIVYSLKYRVIQEKNKGYNDVLKKLCRYYKKEQSEVNDTKTGGTVTDDETIGF